MKPWQPVKRMNGILHFKIHMQIILQGTQPVLTLLNFLRSRYKERIRWVRELWGEMPVKDLERKSKNMR